MGMGMWWMFCIRMVTGETLQLRELEKVLLEEHAVSKATFEKRGCENEGVCVCVKGSERQSVGESPEQESTSELKWPVFEVSTDDLKFFGRTM